MVDTVEYHYRAWKRLADEEGLPFNKKDNEALRGISRNKSFYQAQHACNLFQLPSKHDLICFFDQHKDGAHYFRSDFDQNGGN